jgi:hypothetical protein
MLKLFWSGIIWHYSIAYKELFLLCRNFIWFIGHIFSIRDLSKTLFYPWQRLGEKYQGGLLHPAEWLSSFVINTMMRGVGLIVRLSVISIGLVCILFVILLCILMIAIWTVLPMLLVFLFITSIRLLLQ